MSKAYKSTHAGQLPDKPEYHLDPETTSLDRWAYEFMLRNPKFQAELEKAKKSALAGGDDMPILHVLFKYGADRINLTQPESPVEPILMGGFPRELPEVPPEWCADQAVIRAARVRDDRLVLLEFDLSAPVRPQILRAEKFLKASQQDYGGTKRTQGKNTTRLFPLYLRVLDMRAAGLSKACMLEILDAERPDGIGDDDIRNWIKAAEGLRDGGYRNIASNTSP